MKLRGLVKYYDSNQFMKPPDFGKDKDLASTLYNIHIIGMSAELHC